VLLIIGFPLGDVLEEMVIRGSEGIVFGIVCGLVGYALLRPVFVHRAAAPFE
jgi:hypothetical protein